MQDYEKIMRICQQTHGGPRKTIKDMLMTKIRRRLTYSIRHSVDRTSSVKHEKYRKNNCSTKEKEFHVITCVILT